MNNGNIAINAELKFEWTCRILLTLALLRAASGYIVFLQTSYQVVSPLIPQSLVYEISKPYMIASLLSSVVLLLALWCYFFKKRVAAIILCSIGIIGYEIITAFYTP